MSRTARLSAARLAVSLAIAFSVVGACWHPSAHSETSAAAPADPSLLPVYRSFGEKPGLVALVNDFMVELIADPRTRPYFANADQKHIKAELVDQFCTILGGPCTYTGKDMEEAHEKLSINEGAFNALVEDLQRAMDKRKVPFRDQNKLLAKLAPMHRDVITKP